MNDSLLHSFLTDSRTYIALGIGCSGLVLSSNRAVERLPGLSAERISVALPFLILISVFLLRVYEFDWDGEFAEGILSAFGFVLSLRLFRFRGRLYRGVGLLFCLLYGYGIFGIIHTWIVRADHGHPFR